MRKLLGFSAVAALLLAGCADSSAQPAGPVTTTPAEVSAPAVTSDPGPSTDRGQGRTALPGIEVRAADLPAPRDVEPPIRLAYEAIGANMPIDPVGVAEDGQMEIPEDALRAGWYRFGAAPSDDEGTVVVSAHAGSYITPRGPLYDL
ncbi:MAG: class F sortase, partial [Actinomycetota bacterium]